MDIDMNDQFQEVLDLVAKSNKHLFLTGRAGTGKSTLLRLLRTKTDKHCVVLAPTGLAAINIEGQTIHSFFRFAPQITLSEAADEGYKRRRDVVFKNLELVIVDEISMVRSDLLDAMDIFLQAVKNKQVPFGGVQFIMIGDLYQLPPVIRQEELAAHAQRYQTPYFFSAQVIQELFNSFGNLLQVIELTKVYRQTDQRFIDLLNAVRLRDFSNDVVTTLNLNYNPNWSELPADYVILTATNYRSDAINSQNLARLTTEEACYEATVRGSFKPNDFPTPEELYLKIGARVMFVKNDPKGRWVNGTLGEVTAMLHDSVKVKLDTGKEIEVEEVVWETYRIGVNELSGEYEKQIVGTFQQIPLKLAWSITIHKSQGQTFDKLILDLERGAFTTGQTYVALSRCRSLEGLVIANKIKPTDIRTDAKVTMFFEALNKRQIG
jgi:ATP-dependent exoDNAse (exonuclease V) alpha subunit